MNTGLNQDTVDFSERDTWVFDLDNTLYAAEIDLFSQVDHKIGEYVAKLTSLDADAAKRLQKDYFRNHGTTLKGLMLNHQVDPHDYLSYVHDVDFNRVERDDRLNQALERLEGRKVVFTNADASYAARVLERLGIAQHFEDIFDILRAGFEPKPKQQTYDLFAKSCGIDPKRAIMVEDTAHNLEPAHAMGMGTIWVNTGGAWGVPRNGCDHIMVEIDNLSQWLDGYTSR